MGASGLAEHVERFIRQHIDSVEKLEVLLFLRARRDEGWTPELVARELRIDALSARRRLEDLAARGFLAREEGGFRYLGSSATVERDVEGLAHAYSERRVAVINFIFSQPSERISSFADAFRFSPKKGGD